MKRSVVSLYIALAGVSPVIAQQGHGTELGPGNAHIIAVSDDGAVNVSPVQEGHIDTTFLISYHFPPERGPDGHKGFHDYQNEWTKMVLDPF